MLAVTMDLCPVPVHQSRDHAGIAGIFERFTFFHRNTPENLPAGKRLLRFAS